MALSNAVGGIAAQTAFLAVADMFYREANLEHAAASAPNLVQAALLVVLLAAIVAAVQVPAVTVWGIHPLTPGLFVAYALGLRLVARVRRNPTWKPIDTPETVEDENESDGSGPPLRRLWAEFAACAAAVGTAGYFVTKATEALADTFGFNQTVAGGSSPRWRRVCRNSSPASRRCGGAC